ncbi:ABC transporter ATP-binding protein [Amycolatopsis sp. DSM 110486]|uniref:ABC transporter ATP-binding protein n=1 Tax=Amycolatopsis sp. DSM 110486 TaxID=2865832 RepID=UPI001C69E876|nr:ATP-binding cassette domain-containing protein [Amycolatopsis sp. DSM 110486]QYN18461.1 ATP-binding cassette domain-containing protein [Amycolatopsis sp. DSM 110486]
MALALDDIGREYGGLRALDAVTFTAGEGERVGVIGPNGAGKSTLFRVIAGSERASHGRVTFDGKDLSGISARRRARLGIGRTFQITELFGTLTVEQNVLLAARDDDRITDVLKRFDLQAWRSSRVDELGYGRQRLVELAVTFATGARVLLLDEPAAGLGAAERVLIGEAIRQLPENVTVLLIEHDMDLVLGLVDRVLCLSNGRLVADAGASEIRDHPAVREVYLGDHDDESEIAS